MKHPVRVATAGLAAAAALSAGLIAAAPADANPVANSGPATAKVATKTYQAKNGVSAQANGYTADWGYKNGWWLFRVTGLPVYPSQPAAVSITEADGGNNEFIGGAHMHCENVAVRQSEIDTLCLIDWGAPLHVHVHYVY